MHKPWTLSRRHVLRGAGGVVVALPFLDIMSRPARAATGAVGMGGAPKRFWFGYTAQGPVIESFEPKGTETGFALSECLAPLAPHRSDLLLVFNLFNMAGERKDRGGHAHEGGHQEAAMTALTGSVTKYGSGLKGFGGRGPYDFTSASLDQLLGSVVGPGKVLNLGITSGGTGSTLSSRGPGQAVPNEDDPLLAYKRLFSGVVDAGPTSPSAGPELMARRKRKDSVLGAVKEGLTDLGRKASAGDKQVLDSYFEGIRALERSLDELAAPVATSCRDPAAPAAIKFRSDSPNYDKWVSVWNNLAVSAFHCDRARVITMQFAQGSPKIIYTWLGHKGPEENSHHLAAHNQRKDILNPIETWWASQFSAFIGALKERKEAGGVSVLDNTVAVWAHELSNGNHDMDSMSYVMAGRLGGAFRTGRYLRFEGRKHNDLLLSIAHGFGMTVESIGNPSYCKGPLPLG